MTGSDAPRSTLRALELLEIVLTQRSCNLTTAAQTAGLSPSTALRQLRALESRGFLRRDDGGDFGPGPTMVRMAASLRDSGPLARLLPTVQPHLDQLAQDTGESTYLAVADGAVATYVATAESSRAIRHVGWVGSDVPLEGTAVGEALASPGTPVWRTGAVEPDIAALSIGLPPFDGLGLAISVLGPSHRMGRPQLEAMAARLAKTATVVAADVGLEIDVTPRLREAVTS